MMRASIVSRPAVGLSVGLPQESALLESYFTLTRHIICSPYCEFSM
jgi:hypothetical protein